LANEDQLSATYFNYSPLPNEWVTKSLPTVSGGNDDPYFNERALWSMVTTEAYNKHGVRCTLYAVSTDPTYDRLYGEDLNRIISRKFDIMAFFQLPRQEKLWTAFGIQGMDTFSMFVSKIHFDAASKYESTGTSATYPAYIPKIGDIIKSKFNNMYYEITDIKSESGQFLQSLQHVWEFLVKPYRDTNLGLSATTSASMSGTGDIGSKVSTTPDAFDIRDLISATSPSINYSPKPCEANDPNQFWN
jgi:hypothetical protein